MVYKCQSCRYRTVNHRSWLEHLEDHRNRLLPVDTTSNEQLFVVQKQQGGQLFLAPLHVASNASCANTTPVTSAVQNSQSANADHQGLRHILTAISEQHESSVVPSVVRYKIN